MSFALEIDVRAPLDRFELAVQWRTTTRFLGLFGPSGAGKTTLLQIIAGLRRGVKGSIKIGNSVWLESDKGVDLPPERRGVGYVPQDGLLFPHLDVLGNVVAGSERAAKSEGRRLDPDHVLDVLELSPLRRRTVTNLSGGERQRVALARALCSGPELLLLDEPMASLDAALRRRILPHLLKVRETFGIPTIHVSHDATETLVLSDEVLVVDAGRAVAVGNPRDVLSDPGGPSAALDEGVQNVLRGRVVLEGAGSARLVVGPDFELVVPGAGLVPGGEAIFSIRAEDVVLATREAPELSAQNDLPAMVRQVETVSAGTAAGEVLVTLEAAGGIRLVAAVTPRSVARLNLAPGVAVRCIFKAHACRLLAQV